MWVMRWKGKRCPGFSPQFKVEFVRYSQSFTTETSLISNEQTQVIMERTTSYTYFATKHKNKTVPSDFSVFYFTKPIRVFIITRHFTQLRHKWNKTNQSLHDLCFHSRFQFSQNKILGVSENIPALHIVLTVRWCATLLLFRHFTSLLSCLLSNILQDQKHRDWMMKGRMSNSWSYLHVNTISSICHI